MGFSERIQRWYHGEQRITEPDNDPRSAFVIMPSDYVEYHWSARIARALVGFYLKHWQWIWTTFVAVLLAMMALH